DLEGKPVSKQQPEASEVVGLHRLHEQPRLLVFLQPFLEKDFAAGVFLYPIPLLQRSIVRGVRNIRHPDHDPSWTDHPPGTVHMKVVLPDINRGTLLVRDRHSFPEVEHLHAAVSKPPRVPERGAYQDREGLFHSQLERHCRSRRLTLRILSGVLRRQGLELDTQTCWAEHSG